MVSFQPIHDPIPLGLDRPLETRREIGNKLSQVFLVRKSTIQLKITTDLSCPTEE